MMNHIMKWDKKQKGLEKTSLTVFSANKTANKRVSQIWIRD